MKLEELLKKLEGIPLYYEVKIDSWEVGEDDIINVAVKRDIFNDEPYCLIEIKN